MSKQAFHALFSSTVETAKSVKLTDGCAKCGKAGKTPVCYGCLREALKGRPVTSRKGARAHLLSK